MAPNDGSSSAARPTGAQASDRRGLEGLTDSSEVDGSEVSVQSGHVAYMAGDLEKALQIWLPLAEAGNSEAQAWVGSLYANGDGVDLDDKAAFRWYLASAEAGNAQAQSNVGVMYAQGKGVSQSHEEAACWFERAADQGDQNGQFNLAVFYSKGQGRPKNLVKAAELYRKAAETGHYPSQARLGQMYISGQGVEKDRVQAFLWLSLAAQHGIGTALNALDGVVKRMSVEEKAEGMRLFDSWHSKTVARVGPSRIEPLPG